jgi:hypothetical protein
VAKLSLEKPLTYLRHHNLWNVAAKEVLGSNIPQTLIVKNANEGADKAVGLFGDAIATFVGGPLIDKAHDRLFKSVYEKFKSHQLSPQQTEWYRLGKSVGVFSLVSGYAMASPFVRNWFTAKKTGNTSYSEVVATESNQAPKDSPQQQRWFKGKNLKIAGTIVSIASGITAASWLAEQGMVKKNAALPKAAQWLSKHISLPEGRFDKLTDLQTTLFFILPSFGAMPFAARDKMERKEIALNFASFIFAFTILPRTLERFVMKRTEGKSFPVIGNGKNFAFFVQLASGILFTSALPAITNIRLRNKRTGQNDGGGGSSTENSSPTKPSPQQQQASPPMSPAPTQTLNFQPLPPPKPVQASYPGRLQGALASGVDARRLPQWPTAVAVFPETLQP